MQRKYSLLVLLLLGVIAIVILFRIVHKASPPHISNNPHLAITPQATLANPASVNCAKQGGTTVIKKDGVGGEYGLCEFEDNMACEEWALMRGDCPVGGRKTTGYDDIEQMYCAWLGGQTLAEPNAQCMLPNGKTCSVDAVYNETCE